MSYVRYNSIFFDFDKTMCFDRFYIGISERYPRASQFIDDTIFVKGSDIPNQWMRGKLNSDDINTLISKNTGIDFEELKRFFIESVKRMRIDEELLHLAKNLKKSGVEVAIVTNNMDVFNEVTVPHNHLDEIFPLIVNSCDYGALKHEAEGKLFDIAKEKLGLKDFSKTLLIDDSAKAKGAFELKGGNAFLFTTYQAFEPWMRQNLMV